MHTYIIIHHFHLKFRYLAFLDRKDFKTPMQMLKRVIRSYKSNAGKILILGGAFVNSGHSNCFLMETKMTADSKGDCDHYYNGISLDLEFPSGDLLECDVRRVTKEDDEGPLKLGALSCTVDNRGNYMKH